MEFLPPAGSDSYNATFSKAELYDPATGTWTPTGSMIAGSSGGGAGLLQDDQLLAPVSGNADVSNPATGTWTPTTPEPSARSQLGVSFGYLKNNPQTGASQSVDLWPKTALLDLETVEPPGGRR